MFHKRLLALAIVISLLFAACGNSQPSIQRLIVGKWFCPKQWNEHDDHILQFATDGQVTVWGDGGSITGTYNFPDDTHIQVNFPAGEGHPLLIQHFGVSITDDKLITWTDDGKNAFSCTRMR